MRARPDSAAFSSRWVSGLAEGSAGPAELPSPLGAAFAEFVRLPPLRHLGGVLLVAALLAVRFAGPLFAALPIEDEEVYAAAFARVQQGISPYEGLPFFYLPPFAVGGAWLVEHAGLPATLALLRGANLLAMAAVIWLATGCWRFAFHRRVLLAALYGALAPAVDLALAWGNLSPLAIALWLAAFLCWQRRPLAAGASFAAAMLVKPIAAIAICLLALHRPEEPSSGKAPPQLLAGAAAAFLLLAALLPSPYLRDFFSLAQGIPTAARSASLHHLLHCFGIEPSALALLLAVAGASVVLLRRRQRGPLELYAWAAIAGLFATPAVWSHTLLLTLPLQSAALAIAWHRYARSRRAIEPLAIATAVLAIQLSNGLGGIEEWPPPVQGLFVLLPCFAPLGLALYLRATKDSATKTG